MYFCIGEVGSKSFPFPVDESGEPLTWLNVGTGIDISIKELAEMISEITSYKVEIIWNDDKPDGTFQKLLDVSKLRSLDGVQEYRLRRLKINI